VTSPAPTLQQPKTGTVTRIATEGDVRQSATIIAGMLGKVMAKQREVEAQVATINVKLDTLTTILKAAAAATTQRTDK
jgi:hypothetical protein